MGICVRCFWALALAFSLSTSAGALSFPRVPDLNLTPGMLCDAPDSFRYSERIPYCNRNVSFAEKQVVIEEYRKKNWQITEADRRQFKIDHLIPLCAGGSNDRRNLWPQHESVYVITDPLEALLCQKMEAGLLRQSDAVEIILRAKTHLEEVSELVDSLTSLNGNGS